jgi:hypothetical protein
MMVDAIDGTTPLLESAPYSLEFKKLKREEDRLQRIGMTAHMIEKATPKVSSALKSLLSSGR